MAIHWQIPFKSLRDGTLYTVSVYDADYTGALPVILKGGVRPFVTTEDDDSDMFADIRKQTGSLCIIDDGKDAAGNTLAADWWKTFVPLTDTDRPVTLTHQIGNTTIVDWQGFMQAKNFSGELYGNPQEREFPVQCCLSILEAIQVSVTQPALCNFAYLIQYLISQIPQHTIQKIIVQGNTDAQVWLQKRFDWTNFIQISDDADDEPKYNLYQILEDVCKFWGWTARTYGQNLYLTRADDANEQLWLTLTAAELSTLAGGTTAGTTGGAFTNVNLQGDEFASTDNDDFRQRGPNKATVKVEVNAADDVLKFAPASVRKKMDENGYTWVQKQGEDRCGYFTTQRISTFTSRQMDGSATSYAGFYRRQLFLDANSDTPEKYDVIEVNHGITGAIFASIKSNRPKSYSGGSLKIEGSIFTGFDKPSGWLKIRLGIGMTHDSARYFWLTSTGDLSYLEYHWEWTNNLNYYCYLYVKDGNIQGFYIPLYPTSPYIPISDGMYGYIFIDIYGLGYAVSDTYDNFWIGNLTVSFSRDQTTLPANVYDVRPRTMTEDKVSEFLYVSKNNSPVNNEWNADCIYASDNNMEYGYGLILNADGTFCQTVPYNGVNKHPEQQLADRVTDYWEVSRRMVSVQMVATAGNVPQINPQKRVTIDSTTFYPIAISRDWRDDVETIVMLELPTISE